MSIEEVLDRLEKAERAATAGPWRVDADESREAGLPAICNDDGSVLLVEDPGTAEFIALSRNVLPGFLRVARAALDYRRASAGPDEDATEKTTGAVFDDAAAALEGAAK